MSLVTRCPACGTAFKVVRDQLRISDGWVRCGRCSEVFDALPALEDTDAPDEAESPAPPPAVPAPPSWPDARLLDFTPPAEEAPAARDEDGPGQWPDLPDLPAIVADEPWPVPPAAAPEAQAPPAGAEAPSPVDEAVDAQLQKALRRARIQALREARRRDRAQGREEAAGGEAEASQEEPSVDVAAAALREVSGDVAVPAALPAAASARPSFFDPPADAVPASRPASRRGRWLWGAAIVLAALLLVFQVLRHERDALRAGQPAWQPVLAAVCALSGCELGPLRRIDAVRIEGSGFTPQRDGPGYRLDFTLRSAAAQPLAMPSVELTLLDSSERPVVRRVLHPQDFGAPAVLAPHAEQAASLPLALQPPEGSPLPAVIGYRLVLFYP